MGSKLVRTVAAIGLFASAVAGCVSFAQSVGATPALLFGTWRSWASLLRIGGIPIEFFASAWFLAVIAFDRAQRPTLLQSLAPGFLLSATAMVGVGTWLMLTPRYACWPVMITTAAAVVVLAATALARDHWPDNLRSATNADLDVLRSSPRLRASVLASMAVTVLAGVSIHVQAVAVSRDKAFDRDLRRWYFAQSPATDPKLVSTDGIRVIVFTDYSEISDRYTVPARAAQVEAYRSKGLQADLIVRDFPLNPSCLSSNFATAPASCAPAYAARLVRTVRGEAEAVKMANWLYARGPTLSPGVIRDRLTELGLAEQFPLLYNELREAIAVDAALGRSLGVTATPTYFINGVEIPRGTGMLRRILRFEQERRSQKTAAHRTQVLVEPRLPNP